MVSEALTLTRSAPNPADFAAHFDRRAIPAAAAETSWIAADGWRVRRIDWPVGAARGSLLFLPGRGDCYEKYLETLYHFARQGWRVTAIDWRGQAGSGRLSARPDVGHIGDFAIWIADLAAFWRTWCAETPGPHVAVAHSMGAHLALRALAEGVIDPDAMVLSAPMLGLRGGAIPVWLGKAVFALLSRVGDPARPAWRVSERPGEREAGRDRLLTNDPDRYADEAAWWEKRPELRMGPGSVGWVQAAIVSTGLLERAGVLERIATPVQMLVTTADRLVDPARAIRDAGRIPGAELRLWGDEAAHELLREADPVRDAVIAAIDDFLARKAPAAA